MVPVWITRFTVLEPALPEDHPRRVQSRLRRALVLVRHNLQLALI